jgi:hypothetical protein
MLKKIWPYLLIASLFFGGAAGVAFSLVCLAKLVFGTGWIEALGIFGLFAILFLGFGPPPRLGERSKRWRMRREAQREKAAIAD